MPVFVVPGHPARSVTVFFGYGRTHAGRVGNAVGSSEQFNAFKLRTSDAPWFGSGLELTKTGGNYPLATTQEHHAMEGRAPVRTATLAEYTAKPAVIHEQGTRRAHADADPDTNTRLQVGDGDRPELLHRLQRVHGGLPAENNIR